jgi:hypothetical protein
MWTNFGAKTTIFIYSNWLPEHFIAPVYIVRKVGTIYFWAIVALRFGFQVFPDGIFPEACLQH